MKLSPAEKALLLNLALKAISEKLTPTGKSLPGKEDVPDLLQSRCGAFVSVYVDQKLRGCIGTFSEEEALYINVINMAVSAASSDSRFNPVLPGELPQLEIEISVLTPRMRIYEEGEIELGKHGIYMKHGSSRGTLLPQVAITQNWTVDEFLGNCSKYKTGIGWDGWKKAELYTYEALVFRSAVNNL